MQTNISTPVQQTQEITYDALLERVANGERIFANAGEIWQRCMQNCGPSKLAHFYVLLSYDTRRHYICDDCIGVLRHVEDAA